MGIPVLVRRHPILSMRGIHRSWLSQRDSNAELWCSPQQIVEETIELPVIWDAITLKWRKCNGCPENATLIYDAYKTQPKKSTLKLVLDIISCFQNISCEIMKSSLHDEPRDMQNGEWHLPDCWDYNLGAMFSFSCHSWWRHQMETFSAWLARCAGNSQVPGEFPSQRPVTRSFAVFFDLLLKKRFNKQSTVRWFETPSRSLWRHYNDCYSFDDLVSVGCIYWYLVFKWVPLTWLNDGVPVQ